MSQSASLSPKCRQGGVSIIAAIFFMLLFSAIAAAMVSLTTTSNVTSAFDIQGVRAYQAARGGVEWGMFQLDPNGLGSGLPACPAAAVVTAIPGHSVAVSCAASVDYSEGSKTIRIFRIVAVATALGARAPGIERRLEVTLEKCRDSAITVAPYDC